MEFTETEVKMFEEAEEIQALKPDAHCEDKEFWHIADDGELIWLPTQEQLQGMVKRGDLLNEIYWWTRDKGCVDWQTAYSKQFTSMRTLWLAFVMHEKYQKVWSGETWVKEVRE